MLPIPENRSALLFDCDGTLADTMALHYEAWRQLMQEIGIAMPRSFIDDLAGWPTDRIVLEVNKVYGLNLDPRATTADKESRFEENLHLVTPIESVLATAKAYLGKLPMAVVSGGMGSAVHKTLKHIGVVEMFPVVITADDPIPPKPAPDVFLEAARRLEVDPTRCHVFEDGDPGIAAAVAAKMTYTDVRLL